MIVNCSQINTIIWCFKDYHALIYKTFEIIQIHFNINEYNRGKNTSKLLI